MKVAYITMAFPVPSETFASNDVRELAARGVDMSVHSLRPRTDDTMRLIKERRLGPIALTHNDGFGTLVRGVREAFKRPRAAFDLVNILIRRCARTPKCFLRSVILIPRVLEIFGALEKSRPDLVHAFWSHYPSMVVYLVQRYLPEAATSISFGAYDIAERYPLSRLVASEADLVRTLANVNVAEIESVFGISRDRIQVIYNGVDLSLLPSPTSRVPRRVLTAGRLIESKGMDYVMHVFAGVRERWPDATLRVCGSGPLMNSLRLLAEAKGVLSAVTFTGHIEQRELLTEMAKAEIFLFMSNKTTERIPNVVKEAMVSGCVCVASRTPGMDELIKDGVTGFVVTASDVETAVNRIDSVFKGDVSSDQIRARAQEHIRRSFALDTSINRYLSIWGRLYATKQRERLAAEENP
jgi:colanic acid/amylovoran biosynthesis glycosyltransferase